MNYENAQSKMAALIRNRIAGTNSPKLYGSSLILMLRLCRSFPVSSDFASSVDKTISGVYELH